MKSSSAQLIRGALVTTLAVVLVVKSGWMQSEVILAQVNGTRPTKMTVYTPRVLTNNRLEVKVRLTDLEGRGLAGLYPVELHRLYVASTSRLAMVNTDNNGYATATITRPPAGSVLGWVYKGNGAYSAPSFQVAAP